jgi:acyl-CoA synthetase (AMP-forming)/AMP-acid ligase II
VSGTSTSPQRTLLPRSSAATWIDVLRQRAEMHPQKRAFVFLADGEAEGGALTYAELEHRARAVGAWLQHHGVAGERVLLLCPPGLDYVAALLGCVYAGAVAVPCYPPRLNRPDIRLQSIARDAQATVALTTASVLTTIEQRSTHDPQLQFLRWLAIDGVDGEAADQWRDPVVGPESLAFLQYTSGSTSLPKGVMITHANGVANAAAIDTIVGGADEIRGLFWLPPYHDMGLIGGILATVYSGATTTLMSPFAFLQRPVRWLQAISQIGATHSGAPNFAYGLCVNKVTPAQRDGLDLSTWQVAFCGAEPVRPETLDRFAAAYESCGFRRNAFRAAYGLAEATLVVSCSAPNQEPRRFPLERAALEQHRVVFAPEDNAAHTVIGCGPPAGTTVRIVDPVTALECPPHHIGEIWVKGPGVGTGYWNRPEESKETFGASIRDSGEGPFLRTGDLGFVHDGEVVVTGRVKDLVIIDGRNHYPQDIEDTVSSSAPALRPGGCAAFSVDGEAGERLVVAAEVDRGVHDLNAIMLAIRRAVALTHDVRADVIALVRPGTLPKTSSGKIQRHAARAAFLAGTLDIVG